MSAGLTLQILTLLVALVGPFLAYRYAQRLAASQNRSAWLDALRDDVANLIAAADNVSTLIKHVQSLGEVKAILEAEHVLRDKTSALQVLRFRVRLRLQQANPNHLALIEVIEQFVKAAKGDETERRSLRDALVAHSELVIQQVWQRIERGK